MDSFATDVTAQGRSLDPFQEETLRFLDEHSGRALIADPMGARKTATTLAWLATKGDPFKPWTILVVAPASVHGHWASEAHEWAWAHDVDIVRGDPEQRIKLLELPTSGDGCGRIIIMTYETAKIEEHRLAKMHLDCVVFDEGHRLKGRTTQVAIMGNHLSKPAVSKHCVIVTGTPVMNHAAEFWQYLHMIDPKTWGTTGPNCYWKWVERYFIVEVRYFRNNRFPTKIIHGVRPGMLAALQAEVRSVMIRRPIEELFDAAWTAEPEHVAISVELSQKERKAYDHLVKHDWAIIGEEQVSTGGGLDRSVRFQQIASDWGSLGGAEQGTKVTTAVERIKDLVLEHDESVLVLAKFKGTVRALDQAIHGIPRRTYHGDLRPEDREASRAAFASGEVKLLIGTLESLSEGVDGLQAHCHRLIMIDRHWVPAKNDQAIGRLRRSGQQYPVVVEHIYAENTIDQAVFEACVTKVDLVARLHSEQRIMAALYGRLT